MLRKVIGQEVVGCWESHQSGGGGMLRKAISQEAVGCWGKPLVRRRWDAGESH